VAELLGLTISEVLNMDQWELEVWRGEYRRRNLASHAKQERATVRQLLDLSRRRRMGQQ